MQEKTIDDRLFSDAESRRDLLSVFNTMFLGLSVETINTSEIFGLAGGISYMFENSVWQPIITTIITE